MLRMAVPIILFYFQYHKLDSYNETRTQPNSYNETRTKPVFVSVSQCNLQYNNTKLLIYNIKY